MDQQSANIQKIHEYISSLDKGQRKNNRVRYLFYIPLILLLLVISGFLGYYFFFSSSTSVNSESTDQVALQNFDQLNLTSVREHFQQAGEEELLLVQLPETNEIVALNSEQDYWELVDQMALRFMNEEGLSEAEFLQENLPVADEIALDTLTAPILESEELQEESIDFASIAASTSLAARGPKTVGVPLVFTIGNFQPDLTYSIDFGNGIDRNKLGRKFSYTYRRRGRFTAILRGYYEGEEVLEKSLFLSVKNPPRKPVRKEEKVISQRKPVVQEESQKAIEPDVDVFEVMPKEEPLETKNSTEEVSNLPIQEASLLDQGLDTEEVTPTLSTNLERGNAETSEAKVEEIPVPAGPLMVASQMPSFPGGEGKMMQFLNTRLQYPQAAQDYHIEGIVYVQFVVQSNGTLTGHKVLKGLGYGCDEEALRIIRSMPLWVAGRQNGRVVPVLMTLPVNFQLIK